MEPLKNKLKPFNKSIRIIISIVVVFASGFASYYGQPLLTPEITSLIVTVFSIMAGFIVAVIAIAGDASILTMGSWRLAQLYKPNMVKDMLFQKSLFMLYLCSLILIFVSYFVDQISSSYTKYVEYLYLFLAFISFVLSARLPSVLLDLQTRRIDTIIDLKRHGAGLNNQSDPGTK